MTTPTNELLAEKIQQLQKDFYSYKQEIKEELKELEAELNKTSRVADDVNLSMKYVKEAVSEMKVMVSGFVELITTQNRDQNKKIDEFINSDKRRDSKKQFLVSIAQVVAGIIVAVLGLWASGKI